MKTSFSALTPAVSKQDGSVMETTTVETSQMNRTAVSSLYLLSLVACSLATHPVTKYTHSALDCSSFKSMRNQYHNFILASKNTSTPTLFRYPLTSPCASGKPSTNVYRITTSITPLPSRSLCCLSHLRTKHLNHSPLILVRYP